MNLRFGKAPTFGKKTAESLAGLECTNANGEGEAGSEKEKKEKEDFMMALRDGCTIVVRNDITEVKQKQILPNPPVNIKENSPWRGNLASNLKKMTIRKEESISITKNIGALNLSTQQ